MNRIETDANIDSTLERYFRAEMPRPWPAFDFPETNGAHTPSPLRRSSRWLGRLALAASVALLFCGFLALARFFPADSSPAPLDGFEQRDAIANRPRVQPLNPPKPVTTPLGKSAILEEGIINGDRPTIILNVYPGKDR